MIPKHNSLLQNIKAVQDSQSTHKKNWSYKNFVQKTPNKSIKVIEGKPY